MSGIPCIQSILCNSSTFFKIEAHRLCEQVSSWVWVSCRIATIHTWSHSNLPFHTFSIMAYHISLKMRKCQNWNITLHVLTPNVGPCTRKKCQNESNSISLPPWALNLRDPYHFFELVHTKLGIEVASWHYHQNMKICKVCNENLVEDGYH